MGFKTCPSCKEKSQLHSQIQIDGDGTRGVVIIELTSQEKVPHSSTLIDVYGSEFVTIAMIYQNNDVENCYITEYLQEDNQCLTYSHENEKPQIVVNEPFTRRPGYTAVMIFLVKVELLKNGRANAIVADINMNQLLKAVGKGDSAVGAALSEHPKVIKLAAEIINVAKRGLHAQFRLGMCALTRALAEWLIPYIGFRKEKNDADVTFYVWKSNRSSGEVRFVNLDDLLGKSKSEIKGIKQAV